MCGFALRGFSLIELMVVVAIIAVLSAVAIPNYQRYMYKSKMSAPINYAAMVVKSIDDYLAESGIPIPIGVFQISASSPCANMPGMGISQTISNTIGSWIVIADCIVTVQTPGSIIGFPSIIAPYVTMTPSGNKDGSISWTCTTTSATYGTQSCQ